MFTDFLSPLFARIFGDYLQRKQKGNTKTPWTSVAKVSQRLNKVIELASGDASTSSDVLTHLVEVNPGLTLTQLEKARAGAAEPSIELVKKICDSLGASYRYVWHGKGTPFEPREADHLPVRDYIGLFRDEGLATIWFVRGDKYPHVSFIALQYNNFKFRVLPHLFHVSAENGNGGAASLSHLADLSEAYHKARLYEVVACGLEVRGQLVEPVLHGQRHANTLFRRDSKRSYWWDDLADVGHKRPCAKDYRSRYDDEFFNAQKLIVWSRGEVRSVD